MHPILDEIERAKLPIRPDVLKRWQQAIRNEIRPLLTALEREQPNPTPEEPPA